MDLSADGIPTAVLGAPAATTNVTFTNSLWHPTLPAQQYDRVLSVVTKKAWLVKRSVPGQPSTVVGIFYGTGEAKKQRKATHVPWKLSHTQKIPRDSVVAGVR